MSAILVTGGTGTLGRALVPRLAAAGHQVKVLSRRPRPADTDPERWATGDLKRNEGVPAAVTGTEVIVHCATSVTGGDTVATRNLITAAHQAGSPHLVYISIAGIDRVPFAYYKSKLATERLIAESGLPWTVLRATQFHDLILRLFTAQARLPLLAVPRGFRFQPVDTGEVAARLAELASGPPAGRRPDFGGPQVRPIGELARSYLRASGRRRALLPVPLPGAAAAEFRRGGILAPEHAAGRVTFEEFLASRFGKQGQQ
ncbi:MAG: SDR family oxidoreductase [Gemmatimonadota bacterium]